MQRRIGFFTSGFLPLPSRLSLFVMPVLFTVIFAVFLNYLRPGIAHLVQPGVQTRSLIFINNPMSIIVAAGTFRYPTLQLRQHPVEYLPVACCEPDTKLRPAFADGDFHVRNSP